jgi:hypothetical protein
LAVGLESLSALWRTVGRKDRLWPIFDKGRVTQIIFA